MKERGYKFFKEAEALENFRNVLLDLKNRMLAVLREARPQALIKYNAEERTGKLPFLASFRDGLQHARNMANIYVRGA